MEQPPTPLASSSACRVVPNVMHIGTLPESYNFAADVLEDIVGALAEEGHALTLTQKGFFMLAIKTYRHMGKVQ